MNKQQLAAKIWASANKMRSKIEANEYKDYILGFIFYKFLSDREINYLKDEFYTDDEIKELNEKNEDDVNLCKQNLGYFIAYNDLFSTWLKLGSEFNVTNVREALIRFERNIDENHKRVFSGIFETLETGLSKLGENINSQTKSVKDLIKLIRDIPMNGKHDYDVLGFVYEYLISNFAANAGKKAGEFYTPHEVSVLMSEIVANHLKDREKITIYDPTSGSGSLLINIGASASKYIKGDNKIVYYAQELKQNTYNLTRMNLIMRGIIPANIFTRNGDTLEDDWPYFDEFNPEETYRIQQVDAVVSNPPYSQNWDSTDKEAEPRYKDYGLAPKSKADYAFLLHDLYHVDNRGIMTIVLPHGVLFRGGEEGEIRKKLIEQHNIDTIIGLPSNIFFGTGIPTIIMILKKERENSDVQIIDASKGFMKEGKNNKLRACDIKKIVDAVINREDIPKFSKVVTREEIRQNGYNLNIPRYIDTAEETESFDIYASMFGGVSETEISKYEEIWEAFPNLKNNIFRKINENYYELKVEDIKDIINNDKDIKNLKEIFRNEFSNFEQYLKDNLVYKPEQIDIDSEEKKLTDIMFEKLKNYSLIDKYKAYQILDDNWNIISGDLEIIQKEGIDSVRKVDPNMILKNNETEVQDGWKGRIIPFELIQKCKLQASLKEIEDEQNRLNKIATEYESILDEIPEEDKQSITNEKGDKIDFKSVTNKVKEYKENKIKIVKGSIEEKIVKLDKLHDEEKKVNKTLREKKIKLQNDSKKAIENLSDEEIYEMLNEKWVKELIENINKLPEEIIAEFTKDIEKTIKKYDTTLIDLENEIKGSEKELSTMINELTGNEFDIQGLNELKLLLGGN